VGGYAVSEGHDKFSPSRLAQLENCLDWESAGDSDAASYGTMMHKLIADIAQGNAIEADTGDIWMAHRAVQWMQSLGDLRWTHEQFYPGVVPETGGSIDAWAHDKVNNALILIDWKGSLPLPTSMQGRAYALNLWNKFEAAGKRIEFVRVHYYNYMSGDFTSAEFDNKDQLKSDIEALLRRHAGQMGQRRGAHAGCAYCKINANCETAMQNTITHLDVSPNYELMPISDLLEFHTKLKAVMKRAEALESAAKERLMTAARAGELPGYCVKSKRGNKLEWTSEDEACKVVKRILDDNFATAKVTGLLPPTQVKAALKESGVSVTKEVEQQLSVVISQNSYECLAKEKDQ
jgi:hypothetical protein